MSRRKSLSQVAMAAAALVLAPALAPAQAPSTDLTVMPPVPTSYVPKKTSWGDPDFRGIFPLENIDMSRIRLSRPKEFGNRFWLTDEEFKTRLDIAKKSDAAFSTDLNSRGTKGLAQWMEATSFAHRSSMIISPADGVLPALTTKALALQQAGRSSWRAGQSYDWVTDFDTFDRCISRGMPASMFPFHYNNGIRVFQSPGTVAIYFEMLGTRVIPIGREGHWPKPVEAWLGDSIGHWEGNTLVIETTNIKSGDNASADRYARAASVLHQATNGAPLYNSIAVSKSAKATERLTMTGADTIVYELTYSDPEVFTAPWTARLDWVRSEKYQFFDYDCHEGNSQIRGRITASRAERAKELAERAAAGAK